MQISIFNALPTELPWLAASEWTRTTDLFINSEVTDLIATVYSLDSA